MPKSTDTSPTGHAWLAGVLTILFAIAFNVPFSILSSIFEYPDILRRPAGEVLTKFHEGGASLILTWHAFALMAFLFVPLTTMLALRDGRVARTPVLAIGAAIAGGLAGLAQAIGLWRWVFVVPPLATTYTDPAATEAAKATAESTFSLINLYGGVAVGEHIGQLLTALFALLLSIALLSEGRRITGLLGLATAAAIALGTGEGLAIALGSSGAVFGLVTIVGFLLLTLWLITMGVGLVRSVSGK